MDAEIRKNEDTMVAALKSIEADRKRMDANVAYIAKVQANPKGQHGNIDVSYGSKGLEDTAWRTAQATGALAYMPYDKAEKYSSIYSAERSFLDAQDKLSEDEAQFLGVVRKYLSGSDDMSKDAANAVAERLGVWQGHLLTLHIAARVLEDQQKAFLEGREPTHNMSEKING